MKFGPLDLAAEARDVLSDSILAGIPYVLLIIFVVGTSYYQQRQVSARRGTDAPAMNPQQQMLLRFLPLLSGFWSFLFPAGLVLYWATSNTFRIGQQTYITRQIYGVETDKGKHEVVLKTPIDDEEDPPEKKSPSAKKPKVAKGSEKGSSSEASSGKSDGGAASSDSSNGSKSDRDAEWKKLRAKKKQATQRSSTTTSSRLTPKGTQARPTKPKRKR